MNIWRYFSWIGRFSSFVNGVGGAVLLSLCMALVGCILPAGGRTFPPINPATLVIGKTTKNQIERTYGPPESYSQFTRNGQIVSTIHYYVAERNTPAHAIYKRHAFFYFLGDTFIGHVHTSGFPADRRDFDERKVPQLVKGKSTRAEVLALFGPPGGSVVYPMTPEKISQEGDSSLEYSYQTRAGQAFTEKNLTVLLDANGIVKDVDFSMDQKLKPKRAESTDDRN